LLRLSAAGALSGGRRGDAKFVGALIRLRRFLSSEHHRSLDIGRGLDWSERTCCAVIIFEIMTDVAAQSLPLPDRPTLVDRFRFPRFNLGFGAERYRIRNKE